MFNLSETYLLNAQPENIYPEYEISIDVPQSKEGKAQSETNSDGGLSTSHCSSYSTNHYKPICIYKKERKFKDKKEKKKSLVKLKAKLIPYLPKDTSRKMVSKKHFL